MKMSQHSNMYHFQDYNDTFVIPLQKYHTGANNWPKTMDTVYRYVSPNVAFANRCTGVDFKPATVRCLPLTIRAVQQLGTLETELY